MAQDRRGGSVRGYEDFILFLDPLGQLPKERHSHAYNVEDGVLQVNGTGQLIIK